MSKMDRKVMTITQDVLICKSFPNRKLRTFCCISHLVVDSAQQVETTKHIPFQRSNEVMWHSDLTDVLPSDIL